uniref:Reverse transcriptase Ty1/copia-type domain-containing protein n=1 Tax=Trichuris muris TaxID=70415 RepID=A0A5S6QMA9_TRIMR
MHTEMPYTAEQELLNAKAEFWQQVEDRCYIQKRSSYLLGGGGDRTGPTTVKGKSPFELWFKRRPASIDHFCVFGAECLVHVPKQRRRKWEKKIWLTGTKRVVTRRDIVFKPEEIPSSISLSVKSAPDKVRQEINSSVVEELMSDNGSDVELELEEVRSNLELGGRPAGSVVKALCDLPKRQSRKPNQEMQYMRRAMEEEMSYLRENSVWTLVDLPRGKKAVDSQWVFCVRTKVDGIGNGSACNQAVAPW